MADFFKVNARLLPIKLHFFFFYGAMGGVVPYMPVFAKELGIDATSVGLIFTLIPFCVFLSKPGFGYLTDYFRNIRRIVFILVLITSLSFVAILLIPTITCQSKEESMSCNQSNCRTETNRSCSFPLAGCQDQESLNITCNQSNCGTETKNSCSFPLAGCQESLNITDASSKERRCLSSNDSKNFGCGCIGDVSNNISNCSADVSCPQDASMYSKAQFWIFVLLAVVSGTCATTLYTLSDTACYEVLEHKPDLYGRQRLWATVSWGLVTLFAGFLNDVSSAWKGRNDYSPGFYVMIVLVGVDLLVLLKIKLVKTNFSLNIFQDVRKIFASCETVIFAVAVYFSGAFSGLIWSYEFWYLEELGATQTLLGLAVAVQCLIAEVPMFFFSGWFIAKLGYFYCLVSTFAFFALRFILYFLLQNPWYVLPIELTHCFTWAAFYACMTGYASSSAPTGTEATMLGILGGIYEGLGVATGSLLGGIGFDRLGGRHTFLAAGVVSLLCVPFILVSHFFLTQPTKRKAEGTL